MKRSSGLLRRSASGSALLLASALLGACSGSDDPADDPADTVSQIPAASGLVAIITASPDDPLVAEQLPGVESAGVQGWSGQDDVEAAQT